MRLLIAFILAFQSSGELQTLPAFSLKGAAGKTVKLSDYRGKVVLVNFWATWCAPCLAEMPELVRLQKEHRARGLQVIGVAHPTDEALQVRKVIKRLKVSYPVFFGDEKTLDLFDVADVLPVTVVVDRSGKVRGRIVGILTPEEFDEQVKPLLQSARWDSTLRITHPMPMAVP
jgi:thiol-disulfide isomerase/thioredoxin